MQLEKAKETKQDMERCRLLAQRIAEELAPATAAVLNAETPALEKALHRAGVDANPFTVAARQADLLVVEVAALSIVIGAVLLSVMMPMAGIISSIL